MIAIIAMVAGLALGLVVALILGGFMRRRARRHEALGYEIMRELNAIRERQNRYDAIIIARCSIHPGGPRIGAE